MALSITRALGRICLVPSTPRLLRSTVVSTAAPRPSFSFVQSVGGRPLQRRPPSGAPTSASTEMRLCSVVRASARCRCRVRHHDALLQERRKASPSVGEASGPEQKSQNHSQEANKEGNRIPASSHLFSLLRFQVLKEFDAFRKEPPRAESELDHVKPLMSDAFKAIDKAVQKGTLHRNTGARRKSRLSRARRRLLVQAGLAEPLPKPNPKSLVEEYEAKQRARRAAVKKRIQEQLEAERAEEEREASELA